MLVLSRQRNEEIYAIDLSDLSAEPIVSKVVEIMGDRVRIGIKASDRYAVHRPEVITEHMPDIWENLLAGRPLTTEMVQRLSRNVQRGAPVSPGTPRHYGRFYLE
jgi:sRNA-binding carbon storage regulator CsrA